MCATLNVEPAVSLVDDLVRVVVSGLNRLQSVTVAAFVADGGMAFRSYGHYLADDNGCVHLQTAPSMGGTYDGVEPMGLLWSMKPVPGQRKGLRLMKRDVVEPFVVDVYLVNGSVEVNGKDDLLKDNYEILDRRQMLRFYQSPDVSAVPVKEGALRGMLFLPPGPGPFPGVIDMFGTAGGLTKYRAALLASRGFAALALAYFGHDDLPPSIELHLEYFRDAADWLHGHPLVLKTGGIGAIGVSKGAALAMEMAILNDKVKAVVSINSYCCHCIGIHYYEGRTQPVVNCEMSDLYETDEGLIYGRGFQYNEANEDAIIQVERAKESNFLFIVGEDDATCERKQVEVLVDRLQRQRVSSANGDGAMSGRTTAPSCQVLSYPGAGHLIEPPFTPHFRSCYTRFFGSVCLYGGEGKAHSKAQEDSWRQILRFFRNNLCQSVAESKTKHERPPINNSKM